MSNIIPTHVIKRDGSLEEISLDKITERISILSRGLSVQPMMIVQQTIRGLYNECPTSRLDEISARIAESAKMIHPDYATLASRIKISNLHKSTPNKFSECMAIHARGTQVSPKHMEFISKNANQIDSMIQHDNDYYIDYFGYQILEGSYLMKQHQQLTDANGPIWLLGNNQVAASNVHFRDDIAYTIIEDIEYKLRPKTHAIVMDRPQYVYMRVAIAIGINQVNPLAHIKSTYRLMSQMYFTHATPTLFNACGIVQQMLSCFLLGTHDSLDGIMHNATNTSNISKWAGGIGIHMSNIRPEGELISTTGGKSSGLIPQLRIYNDLARCWNQGGRRLGSFAIYLEPHHGDILPFLQMKLAQGDETQRARDLFFAVWMSDLFVKRAGLRQSWSLFSNHTAPGLSDVYDGMMVCAECNLCHNPNWNKYFGSIRDIATHTHSFQPRPAYTMLYERYERAGLAIKQINAYDIMTAIATSQRESGVPYIGHKDHVNRQSAQNSIDTIRSSNLCHEIMQTSSSNSYACCTLASVNLKRFMTADNEFDFDKLHSVVQVITRNLDIIIDENAYPVEECVNNAKDYRPIGIGIQALADVFAIKRIPFLSQEAEELDLKIIETMYHAALTASCQRAKEIGPWVGYEKSPAAHGLLRFDLWEQNQQYLETVQGSRLHVHITRDWTELRNNIKQYGLRNSLTIALMPTVSTSQIMGNNESFEPFSANIYVKSTLAGKYFITNAHMIKHLIELGLWTPEIKSIVQKDGSIQSIPNIPKNIKEIYLTVWEMQQKPLMRRAALRQAFIDQGQSLNIYMNRKTDDALIKVIEYGWSLGMPTGSYYIRTEAAVRARAIGENTVDPPLMIPAPIAKPIPKISTPQPIEIKVEQGINYSPPQEFTLDRQPSNLVVSGDVCYPGCDSCGS